MCEDAHRRSFDRYFELYAEQTIGKEEQPNSETDVSSSNIDPLSHIETIDNDSFRNNT